MKRKGKRTKHMSSYALFLFPTWQCAEWLKTIGLHETLNIIYPRGGDR